MAANEGGKLAVERMMRNYGCLPDAPDGPVLPAFNPATLAEAIEKEIVRSGEYGWSKITIHMDVPDAMMLAKFLRRY